MSAPPKRWRVTVIEWLSHDAFIEAVDAKAAEIQAHKLWATNDEHQLFSFEDSGIDGVVVKEVPP